MLRGSASSVASEGAWDPGNPLNISSGAGRVSTKSLAEVEFDVSMRSEAGMGVFWVEESMQSDEPGVCSSSSIFVSVSGCF